MGLLGRVNRTEHRPSCLEKKYRDASGPEKEEVVLSAGCRGGLRFTNYLAFLSVFWVPFATSFFVRRDDDGAK